MLAEEMRLDGNALAGPLRDMFTFEATAADATCAGCGTTTPLGALLVYAHGMGAVARCPACDSPMLRMSRMAARAGMNCWLDMRGVRSLRVAVPS